MLLSAAVGGILSVFYPEPARTGIIATGRLKKKCLLVKQPLFSLQYVFTLPTIVQRKYWIG